MCGWQQGVSARDSEATHGHSPVDPGSVCLHAFGVPCTVECDDLYGILRARVGCYLISWERPSEQFSCTDAGELQEWPQMFRISPGDFM